MNHLGLFEGIGGFSLAAKWMNWQTVAWCEWNEFGQKVLRYHFPEATGHGDITKTDFTPYADTIDILTGGFPCQPYSLAGKRKGTDDSRHLWPHMLRAIREVKPRWIVGENVFGLVNWNDGLVFEQVCADLEAEGYAVQPFLLPACGVGAPHRRDRIWFIAYACGDGHQRGQSGEDRPAQEPCHCQGDKRQRLWSDPCRTCAKGTMADSDTQGLQRGLQTGFRGIYRQAGASQGSEPSRTHTTPDWSEFPTVSPVCDRNDGLSPGLSGITFPKWRNESLKALGNAIVPQVALQIFKAIQQYELNLFAA